jgi:hypothetical protein
MLIAALWVEPLLAGGNLSEIDVTHAEASPIPGEVMATAVGLRWDDRCIPADYRVNTTMFPLPNNGTVPPLDQLTVVKALKAAFSIWRDIPTSYIDMGIVGTTDTTQPIGFDFINEVSFVPLGLPLFGFSPSYALIADSELVDGDDLDLDGGSDVSMLEASMTTATRASDSSSPSSSIEPL